jgi:EAL domain-containing protein (putative c-di-GMP-specific phosphodiesterase class I)
MLVRGQPVHAAASIGITMFPEHGDRLEDLMAHADFAMYQAKERRSRLYLYGTDPAAESQLGRQLGWEQRLREALDHDRFVLFAEPILDLRTNRISQYEVLLRLIAPDGHIIAPGAFLPAAERSYLIGDIDLLVVRRAVGLLSERRHGGRPLRLHVNLSGKNFSDASFLSELRQKLTAAPVDPADLIFEITETASIGDIELARDFVQALRRQGYRFAFDDFGIGFACFSYLKVLDVDYVKIAGDFVRGLAHSLTDQRMVRAMVTAADGLGLQTIGEFVESEDTLRILREYGVAFAQGRCVGQPRPVEEVLR